MKCVRVCTALLLAIACAAAAQERPEAEVAAPVIRLTPEDLELLRSLNMTEEELMKRFRQLGPVQLRPKVILAPAAGSVVEIPVSKLRAMLLERGRTELATLRMALVRDGKPVEQARIALKEARIEKVEESILHLTLEDRSTIDVDFSLTPGLNLLPIPSGVVVRGVLNLHPTPVGDVIGVSLIDSTAPLFIAESRLMSRGLEPRDLGPFRIEQRRSDVEDSEYTTECIRVSFPEVIVTIDGTRRPLIMRHGEQRVVRHATGAYLITIIRSQHNEPVPCGISFEEAPWVLEYTIRRVDDEKELLVLEMVEDRARDEKAEPDAPKAGIKGDSPPNPSLRQDGPPKARKPNV